MEKRGSKIFGFILFLLGAISIINAKNNITGAVIGTTISPSFGFIIGVALIAFSLILITRQEEERKVGESRLVGKLEYTPTDLISDKIPDKFKKGLAHYGRKLIHHNREHGKVDRLYCESQPESLKDDYHYELGKIGMFLRSWDQLSVEDKTAFAKKYEPHSDERHDIVKNSFSILAHNLNRIAGHKRSGDYRYIFIDHNKDSPQDKKKSKKPFPHRYEFIGIASHSGGQGREYRWA